MGRVPGESTSSGQSTWAAQSSECSLGEKCEDERRSRSPLGCSVAGVGPGPRDASTRSGDHRQARGHFLPPKGLLPPSHLSVLKTTEEMQISFFAIRFFWLWVNLELEMLPADHGTFYIRCQAYLRLAKMGLSSLLFRSPCTATFCPSTATPGFDCLCSVLLGGWQTPPGGVSHSPGLESCRGFLRGLHLGPPHGCCTHGYHPACDRELRQLGIEDPAPDPTPAPRGCGSTQLWRHQITDLQKVRSGSTQRQWWFTSQGNSYFQNPPSPQHFPVSGCPGPPGGGGRLSWVWTEAVM